MAFGTQENHSGKIVFKGSAHQGIEGRETACARLEALCVPFPGRGAAASAAWSLGTEQRRNQLSSRERHLSKNLCLSFLCSSSLLLNPADSLGRLRSFSKLFLVWGKSSVF